jgi:putative hydrolase of the HAD superfamily
MVLLVFAPVIRAVFWDFGGVILTSPFDAFAEYERELGLEEGFIRRVNATNHHDNAWARLERAELDHDGFAAAFEEEAKALGGPGVSGARVLALLAGAVRPEMVKALRGCKEAGYKVACLTNNVAGGEPRPEVEEVMALFDAVVESSKTGVRKPEERFYEMACEAMAVEPSEVVFLDDLGINLKPARAMGMTTIKVETPEQAITELEAILGLSLR